MAEPENENMKHILQNKIILEDVQKRLGVMYVPLSNV